MQAAVPAHQRFPGYLSTEIARPVGALQHYVAILRFATEADAERWLASNERAALVQEILPWLSQPDRHRIRRSREFWFHPAQVGPKRWKQWLLSFAAVFPLTTAVPATLSFALRWAGAPTNGLILLALSAAVISALMVYWLMPQLGKWAAPWLYR